MTKARLLLRAMSDSGRKKNESNFCGTLTKVTAEAVHDGPQILTHKQSGYSGFRHVGGELLAAPLRVCRPEAVEALRLISRRRCKQRPSSSSLMERPGQALCLDPGLPL